MAFAPRHMTGQPLYGPQVKLNSSEAARQNQMAQMLLREGANTSPAPGGIGEVLARIGTAGIGGYLANKAGETEKKYNAERAQTLARALSMGQDQTNLPGPNPDGSAGYNRPADPNAMAAILMGNPSTADLGANLAIGQMEFNRNRAAKKEDTADERQYQSGVRKEERGYRLEDLYITQNFQKEMQAMNQAFAAGQQDKALAHAANLAKLQQDFTKGENALNRAAQTVPSGFRSEDGNLKPIPGGPADPAYLQQKTESTTGAKMTDEQAKAAGFADRIANALPVITQTTGAATDLKQKALSKLPVVGNFAVSDEYQKFDQAQRDIINAILRRESGAVISESEFDNARKQYFPQPGDSPAVLQQKEKNLQEALQGMTRSAGPAYKPQAKTETKGAIKFLGFE